MVWHRCSRRRTVLPIIGTVAEKQFIATGFAGNGMTFGTLAAMMARDEITGVSNPWSKLFDVDRSLVRRGPWKYFTENLDYPYYLVRDRFAGASTRSLRSIRRNSGDVVEVDGTRVAAYRNEKGSSLRSRPSARISAVRFTGMGPRVSGSVRATAPGSRPQARSSPDQRKVRSSSST